MVKRLLNALFIPSIQIGSPSRQDRTKLHLPEHPDTPIELKRTRRKKSVAFRVGNNLIKIAAPKRLALYRIQQLLDKRSEWISTQLKYQATLPQKAISPYEDGTQVNYLGRRYHLTISDDSHAPQMVKMCSGKLQITLPQHRQNQDEIKGAIARWYLQRAEERLPKMVAQLSKKIGVDYSGIEIRHFKSRWGSCRADGRLQFNWRIMMAPSKVIEYVVIHELCHRIHLNHSPTFWGEVARHMPEFQQHRKWLKTEGHRLTL